MDIVSFYTGEGAYKDFAEKLARSCERFGIRSHVEQLPTTGSWAKNNSMKADFMSRHLNSIKGPIIWCDADCEVIEYPVLLDKPSYDLGVYNWLADPKEDVPDQATPLLRSAGGVILFNYTPAALQFMYQWGQACRKDTTIPEDRVLDMLWAQWKGQKKKISHFWLPKEYNRMDLRWPHARPVINHVYRDGAIFTGAQTLERDPYLGTTPQSPLVIPKEPLG